MKKYLILVQFISLLCSTLSAEVRIGYIDSNEIMNNNEDVKQVQISLEKEQRRLQSDMESLIRQIDSLKQDYERQRLLMSDARKKEKEQDIIRIEQKAQQFQIEKFGPEGEIYKMQNQLLKPVLAQIDAAIQSVGKKQEYDYIFDAAAGAIVYALDANNLTKDVLDELEKQKSQSDSN